MDEKNIKIKKEINSNCLGLLNKISRDIQIYIFNLLTEDELINTSLTCHYFWFIRSHSNLTKVVQNQRQDYINLLVKKLFSIPEWITDDFQMGMLEKMFEATHFIKPKKRILHFKSSMRAGKTYAIAMFIVMHCAMDSQGRTNQSRSYLVTCQNTRMLNQMKDIICNLYKLTKCHHRIIKNTINEWIVQNQNRNISVRLLIHLACTKNVVKLNDIVLIDDIGQNIRPDFITQALTNARALFSFQRN